MDYTNMIKCALDGGASLDDIAKEFTDALNVFNKQNQVRKARQQALDEIDALAATEEELDKIIEKAIQEMRNESVSVSIKSNNDEDVVAKFLRGLR